MEDEEFEDEVSDVIAEYMASPHPHTPLRTTTAEIKNLKPNKCPGLDGISNRMLKNLPTFTIFYLTALINGILHHHYFLPAWKEEGAIPKAGADLALPQSYRPISLLSGLSKVVERVVQRRLNTHFNENNTIITEQFGFRPKHSTTHQLLCVIDFAAEGLKNNLHVGALFLDVAKAYDKIWHDGLIYKLI